MTWRLGQANWLANYAAGGKPTACKHVYGSTGSVRDWLTVETKESEAKGQHDLSPNTRMFTCLDVWRPNIWPSSLHATPPPLPRALIFTNRSVIWTNVRCLFLFTNQRGRLLISFGDIHVKFLIFFSTLFWLITPLKVKSFDLNIRGQTRLNRTCWCPIMYCRSTWWRLYICSFDSQD